MSAVFEFDEADLAITGGDHTDGEEDHGNNGVSTHNGLESGYASENDAAEPTPISADERLYEVPLAEDFISSSVQESKRNHKQKACKDDFNILKVLGRGA